MVKAHKIKLYPTNRQEVLLRKSVGTARFAYNWALSEWKKKYETGEKTSAYTLIKELTAIKREQFPWMMEVSKTCPQYAIRNLESAFKAFFKNAAKHPKLKKKGIRDSFVAVENKEAFNQAGYKIHIPRIGKIKCAENLRFEGKVNNVIVKRVADSWFAVVNIEIPIKTPAVRENQVAVGIDMGVKTMLILSDGTAFENPKALRSNFKALRRLHRSLSRKKIGSANRKKAQMRLARKHYRVSCIRSNAIHQATTAIVNKYGSIVIEDLNPSGMVKNRKLAQAVSDVSFGEIARQLTYKAQWAGITLVKADRFFPSSKMCSGCGCKKEILKLSERIYNCESCGLSIDRDMNAAKNLAAYRPTPKSGDAACGEGSSPTCSDSLSMKQESNLITIKI